MLIATSELMTYPATHHAKACSTAAFRRRAQGKVRRAQSRATDILRKATDVR
jgi:hypothetical protein